MATTYTLGVCLKWCSNQGNFVRYIPCIHIEDSMKRISSLIKYDSFIS